MIEGEGKVPPGGSNQNGPARWELRSAWGQERRKVWVGIREDEARGHAAGPSRRVLSRKVSGAVSL